MMITKITTDPRDKMITTEPWDTMITTDAQGYNDENRALGIQYNLCQDFAFCSLIIPVSKARLQCNTLDYQHGKLNINLT